MYTELCKPSSVYIPAQCLCAGMPVLLHMHGTDVIPLLPVKVVKDWHPQEAREKILALVRDLGLSIMLSSKVGPMPVSISNALGLSAIMMLSHHFTCCK